MTTDYTYRAVETFNKCREIIQGFTAKYIVENILRTKYRVLKAKGLENIEKAKKYVIASNHLTNFDPFFVASQLKGKGPIAYMAKKELFKNPMHPYTEGLLNALPKPGQRDGKLYVIPGTVPPAGKFPKGCVFAPRCKYANEKCHAEKPEVKIVGEGHAVRCFRYEEVQGE